MRDLIEELTDKNDKKAYAETASLMISTKGGWKNVCCPLLEEQG